MKLLGRLIFSAFFLFVAVSLQSCAYSSQESDTPQPASSPVELATAFSSPSPSVPPAPSPPSLVVSTAEPEEVGGADQLVHVAQPTEVSRVEMSPTPPPPPVESYAPGKNVTLGDFHTPLVLTFEEEAAGIEALIEIAPKVGGQFAWRDVHTLVFAPDPGWSPDTRYEVRLGDRFYTWFRTPRLVGSFLPAGTVQVRPDTGIVLRFGVEVNRASVESALIISPAVAGELGWAGDRSLTFKAHQPLDRLTTYQVSLASEVLDAAGIAWPVDKSWSFSTRSALVSVSPQHEAGAETPIRLQFDAPVDQASVEAALRITPTVEGSFAWRGNTLTFNPQDWLDAHTRYQVTLLASALEADGRALLDRDYTWDFWTGSVPRLDVFGYGPNVQLVDADGERVVPTNRYFRDSLTFNLYALSVPQFLDRYTSAFRGVGPSEDRPIKTGDLSLSFSWQQNPGGEGRVTIPASVAPGLYVLEARRGSATDQLIVVLSRYALVLKQAGGQVVTWASTIGDHAPAQAMHLFFYDRDGTLVAEGATEERGLHRANVPVNPEPLIVVGELNGDLTVSGLSPEWRVGWSWWGWWKTGPEAPDATVYAYTDRPIYRPGQTIHTRAVIRRDDDAVYSLPDGEEVVLRLRDARDNVVAVRQRTPDEFGAVYADFELADGGTVGTYNLEVSVLGESARQPFLVEAYQKPDYEVTITPSSDQVVAGETLTLSVQARYFFGQPVVGARVELTPYVVGYDDWYVADPALDYGYAYGDLRRSGTTDANGRFTFVLPIHLTNGSDQQTWNFEATVTDASALSVSGHTRVVIHRARFGLSLHTGNYLYQPGDSIPVTVFAHDHHRSPLAGAELTVGLYAWDGGDYALPAVEVRATTDAEGRAEAVIPSVPPGWFQLRAEGQDDQGRVIQTQRWVWVYDETGLGDAGQSGGLRLSTDRGSYAPGDSAWLVIESPLSGPALLSFERGTTRRETVIQLEEGINKLPFEVLPDDAPNVYVAVALWRPTDPSEERWRWQSRPEAELLTASTQILVPADEKRLTVTITPDRDGYAPRDEATFLVEIRDSTGRPVRAGFSLALVDEAIYALAADQTPHIFDAFYRPRPNIVRTYDSLRPTRWLDAAGRGGGGGGDAFGSSPRSDFPDTAYWAPALTTDADGRAWVSVPLPDSLTSWRAVVRAVTVDTQVGQATAHVTVSLPLSIEPVLPRFLVQGDQATLRAVVHNHTGLAQTAVVQLRLTGLELASGYLSATQAITLPADGAVTVAWTVEATQLGEASVRMDVALRGPVGEGLWHDAVLLPLPVVPLAIPQVDTLAREIEAEWVESVTLPEGAIPDISRWELTLAPSIATGMLDGLEFLIDYPFG